jgi:hypothetical protein
MRKLLLSITFALLIVQPVNAELPHYSLFNSYANDSTGTVLQYGQWETFSPASFSTGGGDIYRLDATGFPPVFSQSTAGFTALYFSAVRLDGKCVQEKNNLVDIKLQFRDGRYQDIASTSDRVFTFFTMFNAGDMQILARSAAYTKLKCVLFFEAVG